MIATSRPTSPSLTQTATSLFCFSDAYSLDRLLDISLRLPLRRHVTFTFLEVDRRQERTHDKLDHLAARLGAAAVPVPYAFFAHGIGVPVAAEAWSRIKETCPVGPSHAFLSFDRSGDFTREADLDLPCPISVFAPLDDSESDPPRPAATADGPSAGLSVEMFRGSGPILESSAPRIAEIIDRNLRLAEVDRAMCDRGADH